MTNQLKRNSINYEEEGSSFLLVSVIIPCYNHGAYLGEAIESVKQQKYPKIQIIIVDDGSTDNTKEVAERYKMISYVYQNNQGLSAARNRGIKESCGSFLVFPDADDLLEEEALLYNVRQLQLYPEAAFVSGSYSVISEDKKILSVGNAEVTSNHYLELLKRNYIGMHATVMYRRSVFDDYCFDTSLKACEDYDLYLKVARNYPIVHHTRKLAAYRMHKSNMSGNIPLMLETSTEVLYRQGAVLKTSEEKLTQKRGIKHYKDYYTAHIFKKVATSIEKPSKTDLDALKRHKPYLYIGAYLKMNLFKNRFLKKVIPGYILKLFYKIGVYKNYQPSIGKVSWGDFERTDPFSKNFGFDRGGAIDRYYIENFLLLHSSMIHGRVLEIGDNDYTLQFGREKVAKSDILHINRTNSKATIIGDLSHAPQIADVTFDCIILTQTLHLVFDYRAVIRTCYRILKPGGTLLLTVPGITPIDYGTWGDSWLWSFTERAMMKILAEAFKEDNLEVQTIGNVRVATAFLYGLGIKEISKKVLDYTDVHFPVIITAKAVKTASNVVQKADR